jgi:antitoxin (DNA-binding transcriptional repressor) of toxin-antitoxin stability system
MTQINVHEAKTHFSRYVKRALKGERIVVCLRNKPVLELKPLSPPPKKRRPIGLYKGRFKVPDDINEPLPEWWLREFYGGSVYPPPEEK